MERNIMPQLRILATDFCDSKCIYCRPTGEGNLQSGLQRILSLRTAKQAAFVYRNNGGSEIKISGGDPAYWPYLVEYVSYLKKDLRFSKIEVITRSTKILSIIDDLIKEGLDTLNFSLDTVDEQKYTYLTGKIDFESYIKAIESCAPKIVCKINAVLMDGVNSEEWKNLILFCEKNNVKQLKLLDYIDDLTGKWSNTGDKKDYFFSFDDICKELRMRYGEEKIIFQGGLGHPMNLFKTQNGLEIICKNSGNGVWYSTECKNCVFFPCHDALMALRVTPANSYQLCLLNSDMNWYFNEDNAESRFLEILKLYKNAYYISGNIK